MSTMPKRDATGRFLPSTNGSKKRSKPKASAPPIAQGPRMSAAAIAKAATKAKAPPKPPAPPPAPKLVNHVVFIVDRSGSMEDYWDETMKSFRATFNGIRGQTIRTGQDTTITFVGFGSRIEFTETSKPIKDFVLPGNLRPNLGGTALFDAVGEAITKVAGFSDIDDENVSVMVIVLTDGQENSSHRFGHDVLRRMIKEKQATDRWSFAFLTPPGDEEALINALGLHRNNVMAWEQSTDGAKKAGAAMSGGIGRYYATRSAGQRSTTNFFTTDMSKVKDRDINKLTDLSNQYRVIQVPREAVIQPFVEDKTGKYVVGSAYYSLTKPETIQPQKHILIMKKGEKAIYGGYEARQLLGLPDNQHVKVKPGNHGNFDIYVQSQSVNRILVGGTKLLVQK